MKMKVKTVKDDFYKMQKRLQMIDGKSVDVGVMAAGEMAWLSAIHEYG